MNDKIEKGLQIFEEVYGKEAVEGVRSHLQSDGFGAEQAKWAMEFAFGTVWARDGMDRKMRSAAVLGMLIALRQESEISYHTKMGIANGLTEQEIEEILYSSVPYCGLPASNIAKLAMKTALQELKDEKGQ